jgi:hypothetical protein
MRVKVWLRPKNASNIRIPNAGHLVCYPSHLSCILLLSLAQIPHELPRAFGWLTFLSVVIIGSLFFLFNAAQDLLCFLQRKYGTPQTKL